MAKQLQFRSIMLQIGRYGGCTVYVAHYSEKAMRELIGFATGDEIGTSRFKNNSMLWGNTYKDLESRTHKPCLYVLDDRNRNREPKLVQLV